MVAIQGRMVRVVKVRSKLKGRRQACRRVRLGRSGRRQEWGGVVGVRRLGVVGEISDSVRVAYDNSDIFAFVGFLGVFISIWMMWHLFIIKGVSYYCYSLKL